LQKYFIFNIKRKIVFFIIESDDINLISRSIVLNKNDTNSLIDKYYKSVEFAIKLNNIRVKSKTFDSELKKYVINRNNQIGTFLEDGKVLFNLEADEDLDCNNPRVKSGCFQYHDLQKNELLAYIGFRSKLRQNKLPKNPQLTFLAIYLMEILNDFYTFNFDDKRKKVNSLLKIFNKGNKYKKLIKEANEVLFFQCGGNLTIDDYKLRYNIGEILEEYTQDITVFDKYDYWYNHAKLGLDLSEIDDFLLKSSFVFIVNKAVELEYYIEAKGKYINLIDEVALDYNIKFSKAINKLYAKYPIDVERCLYNKDGSRIKVANGLLMASPIPICKIVIFEKILEIGKKSFRNILHATSERKPIKNDYTNCYFSRSRNSHFFNEEAIFSIVKEWVDKNDFCLNAYNSSLFNLQYKQQKENFATDYKEIDDIRNKSASIQNKLIVEDPEETMKIDDSNKLKSTKDSTSYFENLKSSCNKKALDISNSKNNSSSNDNIYFLMIQSLSNVEFDILQQIINSNLEAANTIASKENIMLSLVIENINLKANKYLDDIIIEDSIVLDDYKKQLIEAIN
jgi:hypothetical protein